MLEILQGKELTIREEKEKEEPFLRFFFWHNCTDSEAVIPRGSRVSAINTL